MKDATKDLVTVLVRDSHTGAIRPLAVVEYKHDPRLERDNQMLFSYPMISYGRELRIAPRCRYTADVETSGGITMFVFESQFFARDFIDYANYTSKGQKNRILERA